MFFLQGWGTSSMASIAPIYMLQDNANTVVGSFRMYNYYADATETGSDTQVDISVPGYFDEVFGDLQVGDIITAYSDFSEVIMTYSVTQVDPTTATKVIIAPFNLGPAPVTAAEIQNNAVTYEKIQKESIETLLGNDLGLIAVPPREMVLGNGLQFGANQLERKLSYMLRKSGTITAAEWNNMYANPIQLTDVDAPLGSRYILVSFYLRQMFGAAQYAAGGVVAVQYGNAPHLGGIVASGTIAAATINGIAASSALQTKPISEFQANGSEEQSFYLSNDTGAFTTGDGDWEYSMIYRLVPV